MSHRAVAGKPTELLDPRQQAQYTEPIQVKLASSKAYPGFVAALQPPETDGQVLVFDLTWATVSPISTPAPTGLAPTTPGPQTDVLDVYVNCEAPSSFPVIRDVGQSFSPLQYGYVDVVAVWINPGTLSQATYVLELWSGEFENVLHTTPAVTVDPIGPDFWETLTPSLIEFDFPAEEYLLSPASLYTWRLLNISEFSTEVTACPDTIAGNAFGTMMSADLNYDLGFELFITPAAPEASELMQKHPDRYETVLRPMKDFAFPALDPQG